MPVTNQLPVQFSRGMPPIEAIPSVELARLRHRPQRAGGRDRARRQRALTSCARGTVRRSTYRAPRHANRTCGALKASDDVADELSVTDAPRLAKTNPSAVRWTSPARRSASTESLTQAGADIPRARLLVANALGMALNRRAPREGGIIHSDQGVQPVRVLGLQPEGHTSRPRAVRGCRWRSVRQRDGRGVLGPHAGRAAQPQKMEDTHRTRHCDPRLHRDPAQHQETPQRPEHAHTQRIREPTPTTKNRRLIPDHRLQDSRVRSRVRSS
jgi:hypothetical protein